MWRDCPRCRDKNRPGSRFCRSCGLSLDILPGPGSIAGRVRHPEPDAAPEGFHRCEGGEQLYYRWESSWGGGRPLGTESLSIQVFNAGYPLQCLEFRVRGVDARGREAFVISAQVETAPRGESVRIEVPSYEFADPPSEISVSLVTADLVVE